MLELNEFLNFSTESESVQRKVGEKEQKEKLNGGNLSVASISRKFAMLKNSSEQSVDNVKTPAPDTITFSVIVFAHISTLKMPSKNEKQLKHNDRSFYFSVFGLSGNKYCVKQR